MTKTPEEVADVLRQEEAVKRRKQRADFVAQLTQATRGQLALFRCFKEVLAVKIERISFGYEATYDAAVHLLHPEDGNLTPVPVDQAFIQKHEPKAPGYFVVYNAGTDRQYESWSPVDVFEEDYRQEQDAQPDLVPELLVKLREPIASE